MTLSRLAACSLVALLFVGCGSPISVLPAPATEMAAPDANDFEVERVATGFDRPVYVGAAPGDPGALWVLEQPGRVMRIEGGHRTIALDMTGMVGTRPEQGMLGIAFHPRFSENGRLFLHWSDPLGDTRIAEFRSDAARTTVDPQPVRELLFVDQPEENHNGGQLAFGPDGRLYAGLGDGGGAFDGRKTAQDRSQFLGKIIATRVEADVSWEVVALGLRNPWRFSFERSLGELWIGDVGQDRFEEIDRVLLEPDEEPPNFGWSGYEANAVLDPSRVDPASKLVPPVATYSHDEGCAVIGGFVYGGAALPSMVRRYVYGDFCSGTLWSLMPRPGAGVGDIRREAAKVPQLTHIGEDAAGEIVFASAAGVLYRAVPLGPPEPGGRRRAIGGISWR